jgi:hypothetical protein
VCKKGCTRLAAANDKVYQLLAHGRWFSPGTPASSTTKQTNTPLAILLEEAQENLLKINIQSSNGENVLRINEVEK